MGATKTGGGGGTWITIDKPKPPPVNDRYRYWTQPPPEPSPRCRYWLRQIRRGWRPSRRITIDSYDGQAAWYGVYIWELLQVIWPALREQ